MFISSSRFSEHGDGTAVSIVNYSGQSLYNLSRNIDAYNRTGYGATGAREQFEVLYRIVDVFENSSAQRVNRFEDSVENSMFLTRLGYTPYAFSYYVGSLYPLSVSLLGLLVFMLVFYVICYRNIRIHNKTISASHLICAFSWYTVLISGVFYFYNGTFIGNAFLIVVLLIPIFI